jgi:hypothetical protein
MSSVATLGSPTVPTTASTTPTTSTAARGPASPAPAAASPFGAVLAGGGSVLPAGASSAAPATAGYPALLDVLAHGARHVAAAGGRLDQALARVRKGRVGPDDLLKLQADVYEASMSLQLAGKLVEKTTGGIKQVLQTQV